MLNENNNQDIYLGDALDEKNVSAPSQEPQVEQRGSFGSPKFIHRINRYFYAVKNKKNLKHVLIAIMIIVMIFMIILILKSKNNQTTPLPESFIDKKQFLPKSY